MLLSMYVLFQNILYVSTDAFTQKLTFCNKSEVKSCSVFLNRVCQLSFSNKTIACIFEFLITTLLHLIFMWFLKFFLNRALFEFISNVHTVNHVSIVLGAIVMTRIIKNINNCGSRKNNKACHVSTYNQPVSL